MKKSNLTRNVLDVISKIITELTDEDIDKMMSGDYELSLKFTKRKKNKFENHLSILPESIIKEVDKKLNIAKSREEGLEIVESYFKNKTELENYARHIDVAVLKSDRIDKIKLGIVDATVGARLRSGAIQGKEL